MKRILTSSIFSFFVVLLFVHVKPGTENLNNPSDLIKKIVIEYNNHKHSDIEAHCCCLLQKPDTVYIWASTLSDHLGSCLASQEKTKALKDALPLGQNKIITLKKACNFFANVIQANQQTTFNSLALITCCLPGLKSLCFGIFNGQYESELQPFKELENLVGSLKNKE